MKNIFVLLLCLNFLSQCHKSEIEEIESDKIKKHHKASDEFYLQRSWPDKSIDLKAYTAAIYTAKTQLAEKGNLPGFDRPWTTRGPANIGGRINTIAVHPSNHDIIYVGFSAGGVFKTTNGGQDWYPIFDEQSFLSIGDIEIDPSNPSTVYVGTGDPNISGYPFLGDGVYKSEDAGETWTHLGLSDERIVSRIIVDPNESSTIYVGCMGLPFERNEERGLYKSMDGGENWTQVLFSSNQSGIIDLVMDPFDSNILYAAAWDRIRNNEESIVNGENAKIHKTTDGGQNWTVLTGGLPEGEMGRIGLAISPSESNTVYALYVNTGSGLENIYKTIDAGQQWTEMIDWDSGEEHFFGNDPLGNFGWYFGKINVHPDSSDVIFIQGVDLWKSTNSGEQWNRSSPIWWEYSVHADKHDLVFAGTDTILLATDGGLYRGTEYQSVWEDIESIPSTQFYRVAYNPHQTDVYYGGAQDNGSTGGNNTNVDWARLYGGDGFQMIFHPQDPNIAYAETQRGGLVVTTEGVESSFWNYAAEGIDEDDRRNWDMPVVMSAHSPDVLYTGTYRVYTNITGAAPFWDTISGDLTDGVVFGNSFHTISTLHESAVEEGLLYAGTTDGNVWRTDFVGGEWFNISDGVPERYITDIKASPSDADRVFVSVSGYKYNDSNPHVFRSDDRGENWEDISGDLPTLAINDIYVLPNHFDDVIFVATDGGVYGTINGGDDWERLGNNMPILPVYDLEWNEVNNELIAGTFARSLATFPLDSILQDPVSSELVSVPDRALKLFPSPASTVLNIEIEEISAHEKLELFLFNTTGVLVLTKEILPTDKLDVSQLISGVYFIKIKKGNKEWGQPFLVL